MVRISDAQIQLRDLCRWTPPTPPFTRGYGELFGTHITQADQCCDLDFLTGSGGAPQPAIH